MDISVLTSVVSRQNPRPPETGNQAPAEGKVLPQPPVALTPAAPEQASGAGGRKSPAQQEEPREPPSVKLAEEAVERLNEMLKDRARELEFSVDEGSGRTVVKVIHAESGEVIRQMPPEVVLRFAEAFTEGSASLLEDFA